MIPAALLLLYRVEFTVLAIRPYDRGVWLADTLGAICAPLLYFTFPRTAAEKK